MPRWILILCQRPNFDIGRTLRSVSYISCLGLCLPHIAAGSFHNIVYMGPQIPVLYSERLVTVKALASLSSADTESLTVATHSWLAKLLNMLGGRVLAEFECVVTH